MLTLFWAMAAIGLIGLIVTLVAGDFLDGILDSVDITGGYLTGAALLGAISAFGFTGAIATNLGTLGTTAIISISILIALAFGAAAGALTRFLVKNENGNAPEEKDYLGVAAKVTFTIPANGYGEIVTQANGHNIVLRATSDQTIPAGAEVITLEKIGPLTVKVAPLTLKETEKENPLTN